MSTTFTRALVAAGAAVAMTLTVATGTASAARPDGADNGPIYLGGRHEIRGFAGTFRGIRALPAFTMPDISWYESDSTAWAEFEPPKAQVGPDPPRPPLLPGSSRTVTAHIEDYGEHCSGLFTYDITYAPWTWASLNPHIRAPQ